MKYYTLCIGCRKDEPEVAFSVVFTNDTTEENVKERIKNKFEDVFRNPDISKYFAFANATYYFKMFEIFETTPYVAEVINRKDELAQKMDLWKIERAINEKKAEIVKSRRFEVELPDWRSLNCTIVNRFDDIKKVDFTKMNEIEESDLVDIEKRMSNLRDAIARDRAIEPDKVNVNDIFAQMRGLNTPVFHNTLSTLNVHRAMGFPDIFMRYYAPII